MPKGMYNMTLLCGVALCIPFGMARADDGPALSSQSVAVKGVVAGNTVPSPDNPELGLLLRKAQYWIGQQQYDKAIEVVREAQSIAPDDSRILYFQGRIQIGTGEMAAAHATAKQLVARRDGASYADMLNAQIKYSAIDPRALAEARHLAETGKMMPAMFKYKALFRDGDPPPDLALEYYRVLGATILGYQEARTKLGDYVARNPEDMDARLEYDRILTYRIASRAEGLADLKQMARDADSTHIRHRALASWREALPWEPVTGSSIPLYQEWLASHPDDVEIRKLMQKAQLTQASIDAATARMAGYKLLSEKKYAEAASQFQQALTLSPNDPDSLGGLGIAAQAQQHPDEAKAYFMQAIAADSTPDSHWRTALQKVYVGAAPDPLIANARSAIDAGRYAAAQDDINRLRRHANAADMALFLQAALDRKLGRLDDAAQAYQEILRLAPHNADAAYNLAYVLLQQGKGQGEQVNELMRMVESTQPARIPTLRAMQLHYEADHATDGDQRIALLKKVLEYTPDDPWVHLELANALYVHEDTEQAAALIQQLTSGAQVPAVNIEVAILYMIAHGEIDTATALYARLPPSARQTPNMVRAGRELRLTHEVRAIDPGAADYTDQLMALANTPDPDGMRGMIVAIAFMDRDDSRSARKVLQHENAITFNPEPNQKLSYAGTSLRIGSLRDARAYLTEFDRIATDSPDIITAEQRDVRHQIEIGLTIMQSDRLDQKGRTALAEKLMLPLVMGNPSSAAAHLALGRVYAREDKPRRALDEDVTVLNAHPDNPSALTAAVDDSVGADVMASAHAYMKRLMDVAPETAPTWEARSDIARAEGHARIQLADLEHVRELLCSGRLTKKCPPRDTFVPDYVWPQMHIERNGPGVVPLPAGYQIMFDDTAIQATDRQIAYLRETLAPQIDSNIYVRGRTGASGEGQMTELAVPVTATFPLSSWAHRLTFSLTPTFLFTGRPQPTSYGMNMFGTVGVNGGTLKNHYDAQGVSLGVSYTNRWFTGDVGTSPLGFPITNVLGGVEFAPSLTRNLRLHISGGRRMVTDSILSYAGMTDPGTGRTWGGVTRVFGHGAIEYARPFWTLYAGGGGAYVEGTNVVGNTEGEAGAGGNVIVWNHNDRQALRVGLDLIYFGYRRNTYFFTMGQGGYFSPSSYYGAMVPVTWSGRQGRWNWFLRGEAGYQTYHSGSSPVYPRDPQLQATLSQGSGRLAGGGASGVAGNVSGQLVYQLTPQFRLGLNGGFTRAGSWSETSGMLMFHYVFDAPDKTQAASSSRLSAEED